MRLWLPSVLGATLALLLPFPSPQILSAQNTSGAVTNTPAGEIKNGLYRNSFFGFSYKLPFGWVDRTTEMRDTDDASKSLVLLATFEHPPEATGSTINSAVVIAAEKLSSFSGIKSAEDYFGSIQELAEAKGFKLVNEPYAHSIGAKQVVRGDFSKPRGSLTMYQTSLALIEKGYALSFTFIGGSEDEMEQMVGRLNFVRRTSPERAMP